MRRVLGITFLGLSLLLTLTGVTGTQAASAESPQPSLEDIATEASPEDSATSASPDESATVAPAASANVAQAGDAILCNGRSACEEAKAFCSENGLGQCEAITTCYLDAVLSLEVPGPKVYFPFDCYPPVVGDVQDFHCSLYDCGTMPPCTLFICAAGSLVDPQEQDPPTTAPPTTAPPTTATPTTPPPTVAGVQQSACDPNYAGACIPTGAGDVNCPQVPATNFQVVGTDVYGLDSDNDLIACEQNNSSATPTSASASAGTSASELAATGQASERGYFLALALLAIGVMVIAASAILTPEISAPRGGFTVVRTNRNGEQTTTRITTDRSKRRRR